MRSRTRGLAALALLAAAPVAAQALRIEGATVHVGDGTVVREAVTLEDGRIVAVGGPPVAGAEVLRADGLHLTPGLIAAETVLGLTEISAVRATRDDTEVGRLNPHVRAWIAFNPDSELLPVAMANGVLAAVVAPRGGLVSGTSGLMLLEGWNREDMALAAPAALHVDWPSLRLDRREDATPKLEEQVRARDEAVEALADLVERARTYHAAATARAEGRVPAADRDPRLEAMGPVLAGEIPVVVRADTVAEMRSALDWARRHGLRIVLSGGRDGWRIADEVAAAGVPVIVTPVRALPARPDEPYDAPFANPARLHQAGVPICFSVGDDAFEAAHVRNLPDEAAAAIPYGLPPEQALRAITLTPAEVFGVADRVGSIAPGKLGHLVLWDGPPLEVTSRVHSVLVGGRLVPRDDRHWRLWQKYRSRPR